MHQPVRAPYVSATCQIALLRIVNAMPVHARTDPRTATTRAPNLSHSVLASGPPKKECPQLISRISFLVAITARKRNHFPILITKL